MRQARFSIAALAYIIALIAVNMALVRYLFLHSRPLMISTRCGLLMVNVLAVAGPRLWSRRGRRQPFLRGFVVYGFAAAILCQAGVFLLPKLLDEYQAGLSLPVALAVRRALPAGFFYTASIPAIAVVVGLPQLLVALVGGLIGWGTWRGAAT